MGSQIALGHPQIEVYRSCITQTYSVKFHGTFADRGSPQKNSRHKIGIHIGDNQMEKTKVIPGKSLVRDSDGRFVEGNKEGRKFQKGYSGKPKGAKNKKTLLARQFAEDVLYL